ncbi:hypothetical protein ACQP2T_42850 [Nonomuraea sp. CA-143628]|uniref:hypothetical protein n=1 Tax=Nonomuraea sp. CA-143628 TaxID=3239997 RepID=UPI003D8DFC76
MKTAKWPCDGAPRYLRVTNAGHKKYGARATAVVSGHRLERGLWPAQQIGRLVSSLMLARILWMPSDTRIGAIPSALSPLPTC